MYAIHNRGWVGVGLSMYTKIGSPDPLSELAATEACTGYCRTNAPVTLFLYTVHALWVLVRAALPRKFKEYSSLCIWRNKKSISVPLTGLDLLHKARYSVICQNVFVFISLFVFIKNTGGTVWMYKITVAVVVQQIKFFKFSINSFLTFSDFCHLLITFANSLDSDQARQNVGTDLDPTVTLWWYSWKIFCKIQLKKKPKHSTDDKNSMQNYPACKEINLIVKSYWCVNNT